jgi:hypothetical protein
MTSDAFYSIAMLAVVALACGGVWFWRRGANRKKGALMIAMSLVLLGNVLIFAWPS